MPTVEAYGTGGSASGDLALLDVTHGDYCNVLVQLLPTGRIWKMLDAARLHKLLCALGLEPSRVEYRAADLIEESDPRTTQELIEQWEDVFGLTPTSSSTLSDRQDQLAAAVTQRGYDSEPLFLAMADSLGYPDAEIVRLHDPFTCISDCIDSLYGSEGHWTYAWRFVLHDSNANNTLLEDLVLKYAQAHTIVQFDFETP